jgi:hypothetical protein
LAVIVDVVVVVVVVVDLDGDGDVDLDVRSSLILASRQHLPATGFRDRIRHR